MLISAVSVRADKEDLKNFLKIVAVQMVGLIIIPIVKIA